MSQPTPRQILETLFPYLKTAARYARQIQPRIAAQPQKDGYDSMFGAALSDADLSIQTMIEVALLASFPDIRFYGEEYKQSYNTKYFRGISFGDKDDYLVTLDPIDGTQFYLDGHSNYQIILTVLNTDEFAAAIAVNPAQNSFYYALRNGGCWQGSLDNGFADCQPLRIETTGSTVLLGLGMEFLAPELLKHYTVIDIASSYSKEKQIPNTNGMLNGELAGAIVRSAQFIDCAALAFIAQEAGCIVTTFNGEPPPLLHTCENYLRPGLIIAASTEVHQNLLKVLQATEKST